MNNENNQMNNNINPVEQVPVQNVSVEQPVAPVQPQAVQQSVQPQVVQQQVAVPAKKSNAFLIVIIIILVLALLGMGGYLLLNNANNNSSNNNVTTTQSGTNEDVTTTTVASNNNDEGYVNSNFTKYALVEEYSHEYGSYDEIDIKNYTINGINKEVSVQTFCERDEIGETYCYDEVYINNKKLKLNKDYFISYLDDGKSSNGYEFKIIKGKDNKEYVLLSISVIENGCSYNYIAILNDNEEVIYYQLSNGNGHDEIKLEPYSNNKVSKINEDNVSFIVNTEDEKNYIEFFAIIKEGNVWLKEGSILTNLLPAGLC